MLRLRLFLKNIIKKVSSGIIIPSIFGYKKIATVTNFGFWIVGNVFDESDAIYTIFKKGIIEEKETSVVVDILQYLLRHKRESVIFYDIGANTGYYSLLSAYVGKGKIKVLAFEPVKEHVDFFIDSIKLNRFEALIRIFPFALGEKHRHEKISISGSGSSFTSLVDFGDVEQRDVLIKSLDDVIKSESIPSPDFLIIDVEGYELNLLSGAVHVLKDARPIIFCEIIHSFRKSRKVFVNLKYSDTFSFIEGFGYNPYILKEDGTLHRFYIEKGTIIEGIRMFLFLHKEDHRELEKFINETYS